MKDFGSVLIANRGEIAVRIIKTAKKMGYETVALYSDADTDALHVSLADRSVCIGKGPADQSYLNIENILDAARATGADAIHPGYGFLSESAAFARACEAAGFIFIGPPASAIDLMASKTVARGKMAEAGVPLVPGYDGASNDDALLQIEADRIGYPLMVKASAGGGGRGIRVVRETGALLNAVSLARVEALSAFGSGELLLEKCIEQARHIEIQIFADQAGNTVYLGERDCSMQRRNQKVIEESPALIMDESLRQRMGEVAVQAAKAVGYVGAGTVEFLLSQAREFYFLEMNTRLQVEHPVTEMVTGLDLVEWQLRVAAGEPLPKKQEEIQLKGHAIEVRLYAENYDEGFVPQTGTILEWKPASGEGVRVDEGIVNGQVISPYYDSMLAKIIVFGQSRAEAIRRLRRALRDTRLLGLTTNKVFLLKLIDEPQFLAGEVTTRFIEEQFLPSQVDCTDASISNQIWALAAVLLSRTPGATGWRSTGSLRWPVRISAQGEVRDFYVTQQERVFLVENDQAQITQVVIHEQAGVNLSLLLDDLRLEVAAIQDENRYLYVDARTEAAVFQKLSFSNQSASQEGAGNLTAPMSGRISEVRVELGAHVSKGDVLAVLESMKMFQELEAPADGIVSAVYVSESDQVDVGTPLVDIGSDEGEGALDQQ